MSIKPTRRTFLGTSAAAAATAWAGARPYAAGAGTSPGPSETVNIALIGCGGQGRYDMGQLMAVHGVRAVAVCDVHETRLAEARKQAGGEKVLTYRDYRKLLENKDIHAVVIGTIGHWHVLPTIDACKAGKDVYVEKPLGTSIGEGRAAVARKGFILQYTYRGCCRREHRSHCKTFFGTEASMILDRGGYTIRVEKEMKDVETFVGGPPVHHQVFIDCVRAHKKPENDVESGHHASNPGHLMNIAWKVGRRIRWDGAKEQVIDDAEASALVHKKYRAPWKLEV
jgi:hypothetical protein